MPLDRIVEVFNDLQEAFSLHPAQRAPDLAEHKGLPYEGYYENLLSGRVSVHDTIIAIADDAKNEGYEDWAGAVADTIRRILCRIKKEAGSEEYKRWYDEFMREIDAEDFDSIRTRVKEEMAKGCGKRLEGEPNLKLPEEGVEKKPLKPEPHKSPQQNVMRKVEDFIRSSIGKGNEGQ